MAPTQDLLAPPVPPRAVPDSTEADGGTGAAEGQHRSGCHAPTDHFHVHSGRHAGLMSNTLVPRQQRRVPDGQGLTQAHSQPTAPGGHVQILCVSPLCPGPPLEPSSQDGHPARSPWCWALSVRTDAPCVGWGLRPHEGPGTGLSRCVCAQSHLPPWPRPTQVRLGHILPSQPRVGARCPQGRKWCERSGAR